jgi:CubicO group peptidase (beta-lactamase class C family)
LVLQQVEKGVLSLEDTIGKYLPFLPDDKNNITIHQLLSHTSGLPHYNGFQATGMNLREFSNTTFDSKSLAQLIGQTKLENPPGKVYLYSSLGYHLLGVILETTTKKSYADLLNEAIVKPLGLKNTGYEDNGFWKDSLATPYRFREAVGIDWLFAKLGGHMIEAPFRDQSTTFSTGGIHSTVYDLFIWSEALKQHRLLSKEFTEKMFTPNKKGYCYGLMKNWDELVEQNIHVRMYGHGGALSGNSAFLAMYDDETTIIYLANVAPIKAEKLLHEVYLKANQLEDKFKLKGYPNRSSLKSFKEAGGFNALNDYFDRLSEYSGYKVHPSRYTMAGVMKIHLEAGETHIADSLKHLFLAEFHPDENTINTLGYYFLESDFVGFSLDFFKMNAEKYPHSANTWDSLGEAYALLNQSKEAVDCYQKAIEIAIQYKDPSLSVYKKNLKEVKEKFQ